jgi:hypothetical protein
MDGARDHLLAGAAFALDQHRHRGRRHLVDQIEHRPGARILGDDRRRFAGRSVLETLHLLADQPLLAVADHRFQDLVIVEWLGDEVGGAEAHRLDGQLDCPEPGDQHGARGGKLAADPGDQLDARHPVHGDIRQDEMRNPGREDLQRLLAAHRVAHLGVERFDQEAQAESDVVLVIDHHDA